MPQLSPVGLVGRLGGAGGGGEPAPAIGSMSINSLAGSNVLGGAVDVILDTGTAMVFGLPDLSSNQNLIEISKSTGALLGTTALFTTLNVDDHNTFRFVRFSDGSIVTAACGHSEGTMIKIRRSATGSLTDWDTEYTVNVGGAVTYVHLIKNPVNDHCYGYFRVANSSWGMIRSTNKGVSFSFLGNIVTVGGSDQLYLQADFIDDTRLGFTAGMNPDLGSPVIRFATVDVISGDMVSGGGVIGNIYSSGTLPTDADPDWSVVYTSPDTRAPGVADFDGANVAFVFHLTRTDTQFYEYLYAENTGASLFVEADWTVTAICDGGWGVGWNPPDSADPYYRPGGEAISKRPSKADGEVYIARQWFGTTKMTRWARFSGTFKPTAYFDKQTLGLSNTCFRPNPLPSDAAELNYFKGSYDGYNVWGSGGLRTILVNRAGETAPTWTGATSYSIAERRHLTIATAWDQPAVIHELTGPDAALFFADFDELHLHSQIFASPIDADADGVYEVTVVGKSLSGLTTSVDLEITVTELSNTSNPRNKYTRAATNAGGWAATGVEVVSTAVSDPFGGSLAARVRQLTNGSEITRRYQAVSMDSISANTRYLVRGKAKARGGNFLGLRFSDGTTLTGANFDLIKGELVAPASGSSGTFATPQYWGRENLGGGWWDFWYELMTGGTIGTPILLYSVKHNGGSNFAEVGSTANDIDVMDVSIAPGTWAPFVVRTV